MSNVSEENSASIFRIQNVLSKQRAKKQAGSSVSCFLLAQHNDDPEDGSTTVRLNVSYNIAQTDLGETVRTLLCEGTL